MSFFMGFATATLISIMIVSLYVFFKEEFKKKYNSNIIPGQAYYVQSLGEVTVMDAGAGVGDSGPKFEPETTMRTVSPKKPRTFTYYSDKGRVYDIYAD